MKKRKTINLLVIFVLFIFLTPACSGRRVPSAKGAQSRSMSFFKRYGRKHPGSHFNKNNLSNFTINSVEEISYKIALVDGIMTFVDGHAARVLLRLENKFPSGWKVQSWEMIGYR